MQVSSPHSLAYSGDAGVDTADAAAAAAAAVAATLPPAGEIDQEVGCCCCCCCCCYITRAGTAMALRREGEAAKKLELRRDRKTQKTAADRMVGDRDCTVDSKWSAFAHF